MKTPDVNVGVARCLCDGNETRRGWESSWWSGGSMVVAREERHRGKAWGNGETGRRVGKAEG